MKKILLVAFISLFALPAIAQKDSLYVDGMRWVTHKLAWDYNSNVVNEVVWPSPIDFFVNGDSIVNGFTYKKIYQSTPEAGIQRIHLERYEDGKYLFYCPRYKDEDYKCFIGDDYVLFDEKLTVGERLYEIGQYYYIGEIGDTVFADSSNKKRKYWRYTKQDNHLYSHVLRGICWIEGIGQLIEPVPPYGY